MNPSTTEAVRAAEAVNSGQPNAEWTTPTWDEVVHNHSAKVFRLAYRLTGNKYDAEDLTQEVFVRVFKSLANFKPGTLDGWLHRITTNLFLDTARRKQRIRFDALSDDAAARLPGSDPGPERKHLPIRVLSASSRPEHLGHHASAHTTVTASI